MTVPATIFAVIDANGLVKFASTIKQACHDHINNFEDDFLFHTNIIPEEIINNEIENWVVREYTLIEKNNLLTK